MLVEEAKKYDQEVEENQDRHFYFKKPAIVSSAKKGEHRDVQQLEVTSNPRERFH